MHGLMTHARSVGQIYSKISQPTQQPTQRQ